MRETLDYLRHGLEILETTLRETRREHENCSRLLTLQHQAAIAPIEAAGRQYL